MIDPLILAKLAELAAKAQVTMLKAQRGQHWEGDLQKELSQIASIAKELAEQCKK